MRRNVTLLITAVVIVAALAAVPTSGLAQSDGDGTETPTPGPEPTADGAADNASVQSGAVLSGVIAVQEAEIDGEIETRSFGIRVARAGSEEAKADVVAQRLAENGDRLSELEERKERLEQARANGSISEGQYQARVAGLATETATVAELTNRSAAVSDGLPSELLAEKGINATAISTLATRAENLSGPEVATIARSIAGPRAAPDDVVSGNATERIPSGEDAANGTSTSGNGTAPSDAGERDAGPPDAAAAGGNGDDTSTETPEADSGDGNSGDEDGDSGDRDAGGSDAGGASSRSVVTAPVE